MDVLEADLWKSWTKSRSEVERLRLIEFYHPWLLQVARRLYFRHYVAGTELGDYVHYATIGLLEAIGRYDPNDGKPFKAYARKRLIGEVLNNIVSYNEYSRAYAEAKRSERAASLIEHEHSTAALERIKNVTVELAISFLLDEAALLLHQQDVQLGAYQSLEHNNQCEYLTRKVKSLPEEEHRVLWLHYFQQLSFSEISHFTGLSRSKVGRIHRDGLHSLQRAYDKEITS